MKSLFLRVFLWFWLAMAILVGLLIVLSPQWTRVRPAFARWEQRSFARLTHEAETAGQLLKAVGAEGMRSSLAWMDIPPAASLFLVDSDLRDRFGQTLPPPVAELAARAAADGQSELLRDGATFMVARPVTDAAGSPFVVVIVRGPGRPGHRSLPPRPIELLEPRALLPLLCLIVLVVGGLCYWLVRYLTAPVAALRTATRRLTGGDLAARVGRSVGRRRDEIGDLARDFDTMAEQLESLIGSQRRLLRDVSHELRSPLARLEVALELARQRTGPEASQPLDRIGLEAGRLNSLIGQLLTLERLESGAGPSERSPVDLGRLLELVVADAAFEAGRRGCTVRLERAGDCRVFGSASLLASAIENVVRNAVSYTADGSEIEVICRGERDDAGEWAVIDVLDRGPGVAEDELERVFEPFYRVADARDRQSGGSGLGLAITARAVRLHGGAVRAANRSGGGLVVTVVLPVTAD